MLPLSSPVPPTEVKDLRGDSVIFRRCFFFLLSLARQDSDSARFMNGCLVGRTYGFN